MRYLEKPARGGGRPVAAALAAVLILTLGARPAYAQKRHGANVVVVARDSGRTEGELIAVGRDSLLVLDVTGKDRSFDLDGVEAVRVTRNSKAAGGILGGLALGLVLGVSVSSAYDDTAIGCDSISSKAGVAVLITLAGGLVGGLAGSSAGKDATIGIPERSDPSRRNAALARLRKYARVRTAG